MTDDVNNDSDNGTDNGTTYTEEQYTELASQVDSMRNKMDQLLAETKKAKSDKRSMEEKLQEIQNKKAHDGGDFEQLYKSSQQKVEELKQENQTILGKIAKEKVTGVANKLAADLAEGANVELLSAFIAPRLKYTDEGVKVLDDAGELTVSSIDDLKNEFIKDSKFSALLKGNKSSGGGAKGGNSNGSADNTISRSDFNNMPPSKQMEFIKKGGKTFD